MTEIGYLPSVLVSQTEPPILSEVPPVQTCSSTQMIGDRLALPGKLFELPERTLF